MVCLCCDVLVMDYDCGVIYSTWHSRCFWPDLGIDFNDRVLWFFFNSLALADFNFDFTRRIASEDSSVSA